jgi:hypothetical protein
MLSTKTNKSVGIPHMKEAFVPWKYAMEIKSPRNLNFY